MKSKYGYAVHLSLAISRRLLSEVIETLTRWHSHRMCFEVLLLGGGKTIGMWHVEGTRT